MIPPPPPGQGPIDPREAFAPPAGESRGPVPYPPMDPRMVAPPGNWGGLPPGWPMPPAYPPPRPPRRGGFGRGVIFFLIALLLLPLIGISWLLFVGVAGVMLIPASDRIVTTTIQDGNAAEEIAVVPLAGEINELTTRRIDRVLNRLKDDKNVRAVVLEIDSPGGTVTASDEIYKRVRDFKKDRTDKGLSGQVVVSMKSLAASGGYYAACAGDYLFAEPTTLTGNIGVIMPNYNFSGLMKKYGVEETTIVSSGARLKNAGSPYKPMTEAEAQYLQALADAAFAQFKQVVTDGRGAKLVGSPGEVFSGRIFAGQEAKDAGLVDDIGYPQDAYAYAAKAASLGRAKVVRYEDPQSSLASLLSRAATSAPGAAAGETRVSVNGVEVGVSAMDELRTRRLLYR